jgi:hypothetical protein
MKTQKKIQKRQKSNKNNLDTDFPIPHPFIEVNHYF